MSRQIIAPAEYREIFLSDRPLVDLRAPVEFAKGAFPASTNLPLMNDSERQKVGTCYKEHGQAAAIELGHSLVKGKIKAARIQAWLDFFSAHPDANLYCFRGGLRSQLTQQWIREAGLEVPYIQGGYKAMRQYLIDTIDNTPQQQQLLILSGITGSGKTEFILSRSESVDLEGTANHRGSSFGKNVTPQPSQINFENSLARELLRHQERQESCLLLEDESFLIGRRAIPKVFFSAMQQAQVLVLEEPLEARLPRLLDEYVHKMQRGFEQHYGAEEGMAAFGAYLRQSVEGIRKRMGHQQTDQLLQLVDSSLQTQLQRNTTEQHLEWISLLLEKYYDPMYQYQLEKKAERIIFRGDRQAIHQWLDERRANRQQ